MRFARTFKLMKLSSTKRTLIGGMVDALATALGMVICRTGVVLFAGRSWIMGSGSVRVEDRL